jgi:hypothetical protein
MIKPAAGYHPFAYSSPEAVQATGTVAVARLAVNIRGGSRMQESCTYGSVRGALSKWASLSQSLASDADCA